MNDRRVCVRCFEDAEVRDIIRRAGQIGACDFCGARKVDVAPVGVLADHFADLIADYSPTEPGTHYIPELEDADGRSMDDLLEEDNEPFFAADLAGELRQDLLQAIVDVIDGPPSSDGMIVRSVGEMWSRPEDEIWAGNDYDDDFLIAPPPRWTLFVEKIKRQRRFVRDELDENDPSHYLTDEVLGLLERTLPAGHKIYRGVLGGESIDGIPSPHRPDRMAGPKPEHCRRGGRVNPPGIPMLYCANDRATVIAEVRPWKGARVSIAEVLLRRAVRIVDFSAGPPSSPGVDEIKLGDPSVTLTEIENTIGFEMAKPIDPEDSEVEYVPTQYVAELVRAKGFDGVAFKSAVGPGANIVLFDPATAEIGAIALHAVTGVGYSFVDAPEATTG
jgi:hypothetical protein